ncbi:pentapeptide repeat-containing protein [Leptolyngbya sp. FACHB-711]|uniref:pentapeptide repeat-containing protein n=1 Tax=unclassified Leptolyngbya TaxID=2650499 RepID=UPI0018F04462
MRIAVLFATVILALFCFLSPVSADNVVPTDRIDPKMQLLETRSCIGCNLQNVDLSGEDLRGVNLSRANLENANLKGAKMMAVVLRDADLKRADLRQADLLAVDFTGANLKGAQFSRTDLAAARICRTIDPNGKLSQRDC